MSEDVKRETEKHLGDSPDYKNMSPQLLKQHADARLKLIAYAWKETSLHVRELRRIIRALPSE